MLLLAKKNALRTCNQTTSNRAENLKFHLTVRKKIVSRVHVCAYIFLVGILLDYLRGIETNADGIMIKKIMKKMYVQTRRERRNISPQRVNE